MLRREDRRGLAQAADGWNDSPGAAERRRVSLMAKRVRIKSKPTKGWSSLVMRAATRNFPWKDIASELIDNALANVRPRRPCQVTLAWDAKLGEFAVTDAGSGADDIELFFRPGKTGGNAGPHGNSTFGTGLFAIECYLDGHLQVATESQGIISVGQRTIADGMEASAEQFTLKEARRSSFGIPAGGGTVVRFRGFRKRPPTSTDVERMAAALGFAYATALERGDLELTIELNGQKRRVKPAPRPAVMELLTAQFEHAGHTYDVEWGVTVEPVHETGCRLIYGGKTFELTARPCGTGRLSRFYAALRIPRTAGAMSMDLLKKSVETEFLEPVFQHCHKLFAPQLEAADRLCGDDLNRMLSDTISELLSRRRPATVTEAVDPVNGKAKPKPKPAPVAAEPDLGRFRRTPTSILVDWVGFGRPMPLARYDCDSRRLTYNEDSDTLRKLRKESKVYELACVAAGYIAYEIDKHDPQVTFEFDNSLYDEVYRKLIERASIHALTKAFQPTGETAPGEARAAP